MVTASSSPTVFVTCPVVFCLPQDHQQHRGSDAALGPADGPGQAVAAEPGQQQEPGAGGQGRFAGEHLRLARLNSPPFRTRNFVLWCNGNLE